MDGNVGGCIGEEKELEWERKKCGRRGLKRDETEKGSKI